MTIRETTVNLTDYQKNEAFSLMKFIRW